MLLLALPPPLLPPPHVPALVLSRVLTVRLPAPFVEWTARERGVTRDGLQPTDDDTRRLVGVDGTGTVMGASDESSWFDAHSSPCAFGLDSDSD